MEYLSLLFFGGIIGMQHALEADHLAAVAALSRENSTRRNIVLRGGAWGLGHTITLLGICSALWFFGKAIPEHIASMLEFVVGLMIVFLGVNVIWTFRKRRVHVHVHSHDDGEPHVHFHSHADDDASHAASAHQHEHPTRGAVRALLVGMVHGVAGSAGLMVLAAATVDSVTEALGYILAFGVGSIVGMAALSFVASYPLRMVERGARWVSATAYLSIAGFALFIGASLMWESWNALSAV